MGYSRSVVSTVRKLLSLLQNPGHTLIPGRNIQINPVSYTHLTSAASDVYKGQPLINVKYLLTSDFLLSRSVILLDTLIICLNKGYSD